MWSNWDRGTNQPKTPSQASPSRLVGMVQLVDANVVKEIQYLDSGTGRSGNRKTSRFHRRPRCGGYQCFREPGRFEGHGNMHVGGRRRVDHQIALHTAVNAQRARFGANRETSRPDISKTKVDIHVRPIRNRDRRRRELKLCVDQMIASLRSYLMGEVDSRPPRRLMAGTRSKLDFVSGHFADPATTLRSLD